MKKTYRAVVIGCGNVGAAWGTDPGRPQPASHASTIAANPRTELVGIVDTNAERLARMGAFYNAPTYADARECLVKERPDIVVIATPPATHESLLMLALAQGARAIICEKPVSDDLPAAARMVAAAERSKAIVIVNHQRRFFPIFADVRARIQSGALGRIQQASAYYGNGLWNNGTHTVDALRFLLDDDVSWAIGVENRLNVAAPFGLNVDGLLGFGKGTTVSLQSCDHDSWGIHDFVVLGTSGAAVIRHYGFQLDLVPVRKGVTFADARELDWANAQTRFDKRSMLESTLSHVIDCLDGSATPRSTLEDGYRAMQVLDALSRSAAEGGKKIKL